MDQSKKSGMRSEAQKQDRARHGYAPVPPANQVAGAFGKRERATPTDQETALEEAQKEKTKNDV